MERPKCAFNREHVAIAQCQCASPAIFCAECAGLHTKTPGDHQILPLDAKQPPCDVCGKVLGDDCCCCAYPLPVVCRGCQMKHIQKNSTEAHYFMPVILRGKVSSRKAAAQLCMYLVNLGTAKTLLNEVMTKVAACQEALLSRHRQLRQLLADCVDSQMQELDALKEILKTAATKGFEQARDCLMEDLPPETGLSALLWQCAKEQDYRALDLFKFEQVVQKVDFLKPLGVGWRSKFDASGAVASEHVYQSRYLPTERLLSRVQRLVELARPQVSQSLLTDFEQHLSSLALNNFALEEVLVQLCENLILYLQEAKSGKEDAAKVLSALLRCRFEDLSDSSSLAYLLTRPQRLPTTLLNLQALSDLTHMPTARLVEIRKDHLRVFDCEQQAWRGRVSLARTLRCDETSSCVVLRSGRLMVTGGSLFVDLFFGEGKRNYFADAYDISPASGSVHKLHHMTYKRSCHGSIQYFNWIYVFGGFNGSSLQSSEKYSLTTKHWSQLSDMLSPRHSFSPALHQHRLYLCGGDTLDCEVFDPADDSFAPLGLRLTEASQARALVLDEELLVLGSGSLSRCTFNGEEFRSAKRAKAPVWGCMSTCVRTAAGLWFVADDPRGTARLVDLDTGNKVKDYPFPD